MKVINNFTRDGLGEGATTNFGFGWAKRIDEDSFETTMPISPCKDYLNDALYAEVTGQLLPPIYGFSYKEIKGLMKEDSLYLAIKVCHDGDQNYYYKNSFENDKKNLAINYQNIQKALNELEDLFKVENKTEIYPANDDIFIVKFSKFWGNKIYMISLYTLLLRGLQNYDGSTPVMNLLKDNKLHGGDAHYIQTAYPKVVHMLDGNFPEQDMHQVKPSQSGIIHNKYGIVSYKFPITT